jgi:hypothetical protein
VLLVDVSFETGKVSAIDMVLVDALKFLVPFAGTAVARESFRVRACWSGSCLRNLITRGVRKTYLVIFFGVAVSIT